MKTKRDEKLFAKLLKENKGVKNRELIQIEYLMEGKISKGLYVRNVNYGNKEILEAYCEDLETLYSVYGIK